MVAMTNRIRHICTATIAAILVAGAVPAEARQYTPMDNRGLDTTHAPIVSRTDYVFDAQTQPSGLEPGETARLSGWFDGLNLGYGDTITLDTSAVWHNSAAIDAVSGIVAQFGLLLSHDAPPVTAGHPMTGAVRIVVSRATARVDGCPDWSVGNTPTHNVATPSNFGCASVSNLAAMVANPEDLIQGRNSQHGDASLSVKAIKTYRDAIPTGSNGLKEESTKQGGN
jgi:pilus assembly protein CpaD